MTESSDLKDKDKKAESKPTVFGMVAITLVGLFFGIPILILIVLFFFGSA